MVPHPRFVEDHPARRKGGDLVRAASLPGKLRIDVAPLDGRNTLLFRSDSIYEFKAGKLVETNPMIHP